ncbi:unnamed protein product [Zymoseptoria tritici ST99CH_1A5]|uniref:Uncharacterized protein n=1 Tax=Zymoseptoria tritici ST99CH_1A5 TaxID=1276529 RepID=A0A1Y6M3M6_ZYMTR|nr:unnamed protein product [Zymoseptoria tritici ST99CH_1A5]
MQTGSRAGRNRSRSQAQIPASAGLILSCDILTNIPNAFVGPARSLRDTPAARDGLFPGNKVLAAPAAATLPSSSAFLDTVLSPAEDDTPASASSSSTSPPCAPALDEVGLDDEFEDALTGDGVLAVRRLESARTAALHPAIELDALRLRALGSGPAHRSSLPRGASLLGLLRSVPRDVFLDIADKVGAIEDSDN